jgi:hypothetical protein
MASGASARESTTGHGRDQVQAQAGVGVPGDAGIHCPHGDKGLAAGDEGLGRGFVFQAVGPAQAHAGQEWPPRPCH